MLPRSAVVAAVVDVVVVAVVCSEWETWTFHVVLTQEASRKSED